MVTSQIWLNLYRFRNETHFALISRQVRKRINCEDRNPLTKTIRHSGSIRHKCGHSGHSWHSVSIRVWTQWTQWLDQTVWWAVWEAAIFKRTPVLLFVSVFFCFFVVFCVSLSHCLLAFRLFVYFPLFGYFHTNRIHFSASLAYFFCPPSTWTMSASHPIWSEIDFVWESYCSPTLSYVFSVALIAREQ